VNPVLLALLFVTSILLPSTRAQEETAAQKTLPTAEAGSAGMQAKSGAATAKNIARWTEMLDGGSGRALADELAAHLTASDRYGEAGGFAVLYDFLIALESNSRAGLLLTHDYKVAFAMMHLVMLHEEESALFAHYLLTATWNRPKSSARRILYGWLPLFVQYHRGRFPDLEAALRRDLSEKLRMPDPDFALLFPAMPALRYRPDIKLLREFMNRAEDLGDVTILIDHLENRDDGDAAKIVNDYLRRLGSYRSPRAGLALRALARMTNRLAQQATAFYISGRVRQSLEPALRAYFSVPRTIEDALRVRRWISSEVDSRNKVSLLRGLRSQNPEILQAIAADIDASWPEPVRRFLTRSAETQEDP